MDMDGQVITLLEFQLLASLVRLSLAQKALKLFCRNAQVLPAQDRNRVSNKQGGIPNEGFRWRFELRLVSKWLQLYFGGTTCCLAIMICASCLGMGGQLSMKTRYRKHARRHKTCDGCNRIQTSMIAVQWSLVSLKDQWALSFSEPTSLYAYVLAYKNNVCNVCFGIYIHTRVPDTFIIWCK